MGTLCFGDQWEYRLTRYFYWSGIGLIEDRKSLLYLRRIEVCSVFVFPLIDEGYDSLEGLESIAVVAFRTPV